MDKIKRKRSVYSDVLKQRILKERADGESYRALSKRYKIPCTTISGWAETPTYSPIILGDGKRLRKILSED